MHQHCIEAEILFLQGEKQKAVELFPDGFDFSNKEKTEDYIDTHEKIQNKFEQIEEKIYDSNEDIESLLQRLKEKTNDK